MNMKRKFQKPIVVALDLDNEKWTHLPYPALVKEMQRTIQDLHPYVWGFKVGGILDRYHYVIEEIKQRDAGIGIMVDLKFHDIPSVVHKRVEYFAEQRVNFITVHLSGGRRMLEYAIAAARERCCIAPILLLTSITDIEIERVYGRKSIWSDCNQEIVASRLIDYLDECWDDIDPIHKALVCSPNRLHTTAQKLKGHKATFIVPGIRPLSLPTTPDDQTHTRDPKSVLEDGGDLLVIGRPIIESKDPIQAVAKIMEEIETDNE